MKINSETQLFLSVSSMPSNFGMTIYNELFQQFNLNYLYIGRKVGNPEQLVDALRVFDVKGCSVSMPLKNKVLSYLDEITEEAQVVESVNTIVNRNGKFIGYNTDLIGFRNSFPVSGIHSALVYGTGSVSDSIIFELKKRGVEVFSWGRDSAAVSQKANKWKVDIYNGKKFDIFINATPVSLFPINDDLMGIIDKCNCVFDLIVKQKTYLSSYCNETKKIFYSGFEMYKYQFCEQFKLYTGLSIDPEIVEKIARNKKLI